MAAEVRAARQARAVARADRPAQPAQWVAVKLVAVPRALRAANKVAAVLPAQWAVAKLAAALLAAWAVAAKWGAVPRVRWAAMVKQAVQPARWDRQAVHPAAVARPVVVRPVARQVQKVERRAAVRVDRWDLPAARTQAVSRRRARLEAGPAVVAMRAVAAKSAAVALVR